MEIRTEEVTSTKQGVGVTDSCWQKIGRKLHQIINQVHVYPTLSETGIKFFLFLVSFIVSVIACLNETDISKLADGQSEIGFGSAVMVYGLSLIIEVCMLLDEHKLFWEKCFVGTIAILGFVITGLGFLYMLKPRIIPFGVDFTAIICALPVVIYLMDTILFYFIPPMDNPNVRIDKRKNIEDAIRQINT